MLARDVEIADIDGRHWENWLRLLAPPGVMDDPRFAVVWVAEGQVIHAVIRGQGAIDPAAVPFAGVSQPALATLREALEVGALVVLDHQALTEIVARIDQQMSMSDDYVAQGLTMLRAAKELAGAGVWSEPRLLELLPSPPFEALQRTFDFLVPDNSALVAYVFEDDGSEIHASIIATKVDGHIDQVATHAAIADRISSTRLARDWRTQRKQVLEAVTARFAEPSVAVFLDRASYYRVLTGPTDTLARAIRARRVVIDPAPAWLLGLLGGATVAAVATRGARALAQFLPPQARKMASDLASQARTAAASAGADPWALLGFDPIELWLSVRHLYGARGDSSSPSIR